jgi:hypothetical protein
MLIDANKTITGIIYSEVTMELTIKYNDGNVVKYVNVPKSVYESILESGKNVSGYLKESLDTNYKKIELV